MKRFRFILAATLGLLLIFAGLAQVGDAQDRRLRGRPNPSSYQREGIITDASVPGKEFTFARLIYGGQGRRYWAWATDAPEADVHFIAGIRRLTNISVRNTYFYIPLTAQEIFKYPFLYAVEVGYLDFSEAEAAVLREYLRRGGFLVVDDFHGTYEWANFERQIRKVLPSCQIEELPLAHPIFHCFFDIKKLIQVPGIHIVNSGRTYERDGYDPHYRGIFDETGRLMVVINFNSDLGDAWEWVDTPAYPAKYATAAYHLGINYVIYSMSH